MPSETPIALRHTTYEMLLCLQARATQMSTAPNQVQEPYLGGLMTDTECFRGAAVPVTTIQSLEDAEEEIRGLDMSATTHSLEQKPGTYGTSYPLVVN